MIRGSSFHHMLDNCNSVADIPLVAKSAGFESILICVISRFSALRRFLLDFQQRFQEELILNEIRSFETYY